VELFRAQGNTPAPSPDAKVKVDLQVYVLVSGQSANVTSGTLTFQGKDYPFKVKGIGLYKIKWARLTWLRTGPFIT